MRLNIEAGVLSLTLLHILFGAHSLALCTHEMSPKKNAQNMHQSVTSTIDCKNVLFISLKKITSWRPVILLKLFLLSIRSHSLWFTGNYS